MRAAGLPYCVLRPTGLTNESEPGDFLLEASQGEALCAYGSCMPVLVRSPGALRCYVIHLPFNVHANHWPTCQCCGIGSAPLRNSLRRCSTE